MSAVRTCVGCRGRDTTDQLVRVVLTPEGFAADVSRTAGGRGAHVHRDRQCLDHAVARKALTRALRVSGEYPVTSDLADLMS